MDLGGAELFDMNVKNEFGSNFDLDNESCMHACMHACLRSLKG
jgi:aspartyl aminopeptidase